MTKARAGTRKCESVWSGTFSADRWTQNDSYAVWDDQLLTCCNVTLRNMTKLKEEVGNIKAFGAALSAQIDGLRMIPMLFGMINF